MNLPHRLLVPAQQPWLPLLLLTLQLEPARTQGLLPTKVPTAPMLSLTPTPRRVPPPAFPESPGPWAPMDLLSEGLTMRGPPWSAEDLPRETPS